MANDKSVSRRKFIASAGAAAGLSAIPFIKVHGQGKLRPVSMRLDWLFQGPNVGFIVAKEKGYYEQAGLDVAIGPGKGSGSTAQLTANKDCQFGFADGYVVGNGVSKGMNITMVASIYRRNPTAVVVLEDSDIRTVKDLEGKTVAMPTGATQFQQWPAFVKGCGLDGNKISVVSVDPAGMAPALITGKVNAISTYAQGGVPGIEIRGKKKVRMLWYADCGVTAVSNGIIVHNDLIKEDPALIRAFVAASIRGFLYGRKQPDEMAAIVKKYDEAADARTNKREAELSWNNWLTPNTMGKPLGWMSDKDWAATVNVLRQYGGVTTPLDARKLYTNDFVPTGAEYIPPQS
jgi:NitT/TauT family transport system substrate-binding protein